MYIDILYIFIIIYICYIYICWIVCEELLVYATGCIIWNQTEFICILPRFMFAFLYRRYRSVLSLGFVFEVHSSTWLHSSQLRFLSLFSRTRFMMIGFPFVLLDLLLLHSIHSVHQLTSLKSIRLIVNIIFRQYSLYLFPQFLTDLTHFKLKN